MTADSLSFFEWILHLAGFFALGYLLGSTGRTIIEYVVEDKTAEREREQRLHELKVLDEKNFHERCMAPFKRFEALDQARATAYKNEGGAA